MRRDLIIGILFSALLHGGVFFGDRLFPDKVVTKKVVEEAPTIEIIEMPKLEPEEPEIVEATDEPVKPIDFAPPMQTDVPQPITDTSFVQKIQPPPPENIRPATGVLTVLGDRADMSRFRGIEVFDLSKLDQKPIPQVQGQPVYPYEMRRSGVNGEVLVEFIVDTTGAVQNAQAVRSSHREFEAAAVQAVSKWRFKPGRRGGRAVYARMQVPIVFNLNEN